jgi:hypothetical protein
MRLALVIFLLSSWLYSCNAPDPGSAGKDLKSDSLAKLTPVSLAGQVYIYAPDLDTLSCMATGACDCCSGKFLFLNDSNFISIDNCMSDEFYRRGFYRFINGDLVMTTGGVSVNRQYNWENDTDTTGKILPEYLYTITLSTAVTRTLKRVTCGGTVCFLMSDGERYFVTADRHIKLSEEIAALKKDMVWNRLYP